MILVNFQKPELSKLCLTSLVFVVFIKNKVQDLLALVIASAKNIPNVPCYLFVSFLKITVRLWENKHRFKGFDEMFLAVVKG